MNEFHFSVYIEFKIVITPKRRKGLSPVSNLTVSYPKSTTYKMQFNTIINTRDLKRATLQLKETYTNPDFWFKGNSPLFDISVQITNFNYKLLNA